MNTLKALVFVLGLAVAIAAPGTALAAAPANDGFAAAAELTGRVAYEFTTNEDATKELGEPNHAGNAGGKSIWYRWTAPAAGRVTLSCWSEFNTLLAVYTGDTLATLAPVASNADACDGPAAFSFQAVAGTQYRIAVDGVDGDSGYIDLYLRLAPPNDDFADATALAADAGSTSGMTVGASFELGEPDHVWYSWNSVWFKWTAQSNGWATFETCGSQFETVVAVYTGPAVNQLSAVASNGGECYPGSRVHFQASAGTEYRIAVAGEDGDFTLAWHRNPPPPILAALPQITGLARDGETLTASDGAWLGDGPFAYAYAWGRCDLDWECESIPGATSKTFGIRSVDVGYRLSVRVTASNPWGSNSASSYETAVVVARPPSNTSSPVVDGQGRLGAILVASPGNWVGTAPITYAYQWQACDWTGTTCSNIEGQSGQVMRVTSVDLGDVLRVVVTATNVAGSASAASFGTDLEPVARPQPRCVVPNVRGKTLRAARAAIRRKRCRVGRIRRTFSTRARAGRVLSQTPRAGARRANGARVHLVVSKGARR